MNHSLFITDRCIYSCRSDGQRWAHRCVRRCKYKLLVSIKYVQWMRYVEGVALTCKKQIKDNSYRQSAFHSHALRIIGTNQSGVIISVGRPKTRIERTNVQYTWRLHMRASAQFPEMANTWICNNHRWLRLACNAATAAIAIRNKIYYACESSSHHIFRIGEKMSSVPATGKRWEFRWYFLIDVYNLHVVIQNSQQNFQNLQ